MPWSLTATQSFDNFFVDDVQINANEITTSTTDVDVVSANGAGKVVFQDGQEVEFGTTGDLELVWDDSAADLQIRRPAGGNAAAPC